MKSVIILIAGLFMVSASASVSATTDPVPLHIPSEVNSPNEVHDVTLFTITPNFEFQVNVVATATLFIETHTALFSGAKSFQIGQFAYLQQIEATGRICAPPSRDRWYNIHRITLHKSFSPEREI